VREGKKRRKKTLALFDVKYLVASARGPIEEKKKGKGGRSACLTSMSLISTSGKKRKRKGSGNTLSLLS